MSRQPNRARPKHAYSPLRRPSRSHVMLDRGWNEALEIADPEGKIGGITIGEILSMAKSSLAKDVARFRRRGIDKYNKSFRLPRNGICPACEEYIGDTYQSWINRPGFAPVCRKCWNAGARYHEGTLPQQMTQRERLASERSERLARVQAVNGICWACLRSVPTLADAPGLLWIVKPGFAPTCRACWQGKKRLPVE